MKLPPVTAVLVHCLGFFGVAGVDNEGRTQNSQPPPPLEDLADTNPDQENPVASQNSFYPSFSPFDYQPLGHSRPFYFNNHQQEGAYSQKSEPFQQVFESPAKFSGYKNNFQSVSAAPSTEAALGLLGSGNFGVIPGGTFYSQNEKDQAPYADYESYFHNGHGRPSFYFAGASNPKPYKHEQFANFRDFADINTPDRQYSQYVVVYVNKNGTGENAEPKKHHPKNIMESLAMLDLENSAGTEETPKKKLSKSKRKLAKLPPEKKHFVKSSQKSKQAKDLSEPLLALS